MADRSSLFTVKYLMRVGVIPYLIVDYDKFSIKALSTRKGVSLLCNVQIIPELDGIVYVHSLNICPVANLEIDALILAATKLVVDYDIVEPEICHELLSLIPTAWEIYNSVEESDLPDKTFTDKDFKMLAKKASQARYNKDNWDT